MAQDTAALWMCFEMIQAQELVPGSRGMLPCKVGLSHMYTAAPTPDSDENHVFWALCKKLRKRLTISTPENILYSIGTKRVQPLSQTETASSEKMCPLPLPVLPLLPPLTLTLAEGICLCQNRVCTIRIIQIWSLSSPGRTN